MPRTLVATVLALFALGGCLRVYLPTRPGGEPPPTGSGVIVDETRRVEAFDELSVAGAIIADVVVGGEQSVVVTADDEVVPLVRTTVAGGRLAIDYLPGTTARPSRPVRVRVSVPRLRSVEASLAATVEVVGLEAKNGQLVASGASTIQASGLATELTVTASGASHIEADGLAAQGATVTASGASRVRVDAQDALTVDASGASWVCYAHRPGQLRPTTSGASTVLPCP